MRAVVLALCALSLGGRASVQAQLADLRNADLPRGVAEELQAVIDHPNTLRYTGPATIEADRTVPGSVAVFDGLLTIAGRVEGDVVVVNGSLAFESGASVTGNVTVVAGVMRGEDVARIGGTVTVYGEGFSLARRIERFVSGRDSDWENEHDDDFGRSQFRFAISQNYNRVEGLPLEFGPDLWTNGPYPFHLQAMAIWRTATGSPFDTEDMGYFLRAEQFLPGWVRVGGTFRSTVQPIEDWTITDLEASLSTALFHDDYRDYFSRSGWSTYVRITPRHSPLDVRFEYRDESHETEPVRDPWTLFDDDDLWRPQPLAAEGDVDILSGSVTLDFRRGRDRAPRGSLFRASVLHQVGGELLLPTVDPVVTPRSFDHFTTGLLDLRTYQRIGWNGVIAFRGVGGGSFEAEALPPQFQHALGGIGTLPGYANFDVDCSARTALVIRTGDDANAETFFPRYGCDRFALFQAEYRGGLEFRIGDHDRHDDRNRRGGDEWGWRGWEFDTTLNWTLFFDAARAWSYDVAASTFDTGALYDVGAGIVFSGLGVYAALPLTGEDRDMRFFIRLGPRF
jgi:hypothetical protein